MPKLELPKFISEATVRKHGRAAAKNHAQTIISEGLAMNAEDVIVMPEGEFYSRARLPSGDPTSFYLYVGTLRHG